MPVPFFDSNFNQSGNSKDLKCVVCGPWSVVRGPCQLIPTYVHYYVNTIQYCPWSVSIDSHVQYISFSLFMYLQNNDGFSLFNGQREDNGGGFGGVPPPSRSTDVSTLLLLLTYFYLLSTYYVNTVQY